MYSYVCARTVKWLTEYKRFLKSAVPIVIAKLTCPDVSTDKVRVSTGIHNKSFWEEELWILCIVNLWTMWISQQLFLYISLHLNSLSPSPSLYFSLALLIYLKIYVSLNSILRMKKLKWQRWHRQQQHFPLDNNLSTWINRR